MDCEKQELFEAELKLLRCRERHPYLNNFVEYLSKGDLVLDLGCGLLVNSHYLEDNGFKVFGMDISFEMLKEDNRKTVPLICADGLRLPFKKNCFGGVILADIVEHLPRAKIDEFMAEVQRILKETGIIFLHVPLENSISYRILHRLGLIWSKNPNHLHDYNLKEIKQFIESKKYKINWEHKDNGIFYFLGSYLRGIKPFIIVSRFLWRYFQNIFTTAYTACLGFRR